jgi:myosin heavy subunit
MAESIKKSDLIEGKPFADIATEISGTLKVLEDYDTKIVSIAKHLKGDLKDANTQTLKGLKELHAAGIESEKLAQQKIKTQSDALKLSEAERKAREAATKATEKQNKSEKDLNSAYKQLEKSTRDLKNQSKELGAQMLHLEKSGQKNSARYRELAHQYSAVTRAAQQGDAQLKKLDKTVGDNFRNVGNYQSALGGLNNILAKLGITFGAGMIVQDSVQVVRDFGQENARLSAILQKTTEETAELQEQQRALGASTKFTAAEVASLQIELAKLGFSEAQIKASTESVLQLAQASGTDLATASMTAASTLRAFGFEASEMTRVSNVMAAGFVTSGLDMSNFTESMKYVAPVAKSAGVSIEQTTAMLAALADSGIKGSQAGTSLRRILSDMATTGKPATEALREVVKGGISLTDAFDEVGRTAQTSLIILGDNMDKVDKLTAKYNDAEGTVNQMAATMSNTLDGAFAKLRSAFEEQILQLNDMSKGGQGLKATLEFLANNIGTIFSIIGKLTRAFIAYKTVQLSIIAIEKARAFSIRDFGARMLATIPFTKQYAAAQQQAAAASTQAGTAATNAGRSMMAVPWLAIIGILFEVGKAFWDITSGAKAAREAAEMFDKQTAAAAKNAQNQSTKRTDALNKEIAAIQRKGDEDKANAKTEKEKAEIDKRVLQQKEEILKKENDFLTTNIKLRNERKQEVKTQQDQLKALKSVNNMIVITDESEKKRLVSLMQNLGLTKDEILEFNGAISTAARDKALAVLKTKTGVLNEDLKVMYDELGNVKENLKDATTATKTHGKAVTDSTKEAKEYNTEFKRTNDLISEQAKLLNELKKIQEDRADMSRKKEIDSAIRLEVQAIEQTGEMNAEAIEDMIKFRYDLERQSAKEQTEFEVSELNERHEREKKQRLQALNDNRDNLVKGAKGNTDALKKIEENYQIELQVLELEELKRKEDLDLQIVVLREKLKNELLKIEDDENKEISSANDEFIEALIAFYDKQNEIARDAAKEKMEAEKKIAEERKALEKSVRDTLDKYGEQAIDREVERSRRRQEILNREISDLQRQQDQLREMANNGNADAQKSLAVSEQTSLKKQQQIEREAKKQQALETAKIAYKAVFDFLEKGDSLPVATVKGATGAMTMQALFKSLFGFRKGTKRTVGEELNTKFSSGEDGFIARVDAREKILNPELSAMTGSATTDEIVHGFLRSQSGLAVQMPKVTVSQNNNELIGKIDELKHVIKNKKELDLSVELRQGLARSIISNERSGINRNRTFYRR